MKKLNEMMSEMTEEEPFEFPERYSARPRRRQGPDQTLLVMSAMAGVAIGLVTLMLAGQV